VAPDRECLGEINPGACAFKDSNAEFHAHLAKRAEALWKARHPGLLTKAANLARAVVTHTLAGLPSAPEDIAQARLENRGQDTST
jgi:hypothetical protein